MKQITIDDLIPLLKKGWVAMDNNGMWWWYRKKPKPVKKHKWWNNNKYSEYTPLSSIEKKDIAPFDGDWKQSLRRIK